MYNFIIFNNNFFKLLSKFFNQHISIIVSLIYLFFPLNFYAPSQISSVSSSILISSFYLPNYKSKKIKIYNFGNILRFINFNKRRILAFIFDINNFQTFKNPKQIIKIILCLLMVVCIVSPKIVSNYKKFDQIILTKSFGYNLWRGNNDELNINGSNIDMTDKKILNIFFHQSMI